MSIHIPLPYFRGDVKGERVEMTVLCSQDMVTPLAKTLNGNCHWNRDTTRSVAEAGFQVSSTRDLGGIFLPMIILQATR